jgi:hypothetical protein
MPLNGWLWAMGALRNYAQQRRQQKPQRGFGLSVNELEPILRVGGDAAEMKFMECCRYLWQADGAELTEPFIEAAFKQIAREVTLRSVPADVDDCLPGARCRAIASMKPLNVLPCSREAA